MTSEYIDPEVKHIMILFEDNPYYTAECIKALAILADDYYRQLNNLPPRGQPKEKLLIIREE